MKALAQFDAELKKVNSYEILGNNFIKYIFTFLGVGLLFITPATEDKIVLGMVWTFLAYCVVLHLNVVLYVGPNGKKVSVYKILGQSPINKKMYINVRVKYLFSYLFKWAIPATIMQALGVWHEGVFTVQSILSSVIYLAVLFGSCMLLGITHIYRSTR